MHAAWLSVICEPDHKNGSATVEKLNILSKRPESFPAGVGAIPDILQGTGL